MRLLQVEEEVLLGNGIEAGLRQAGFIVDWLKDGKQAQLALETINYELILLDLGLPRLSGLDLLQGLRAKRKDLPVLILTTCDTVQDR